MIFRRLWEEADSDSDPRRRALSLLAEMWEYMPDIVFLLVYFLLYSKSKVIHDDDRDILADFEELCFILHRKTSSSGEEPDEKQQQELYQEYIASCLDRCGHQDHRMVVHLAKFLYREAPRITRDSALVAHAIIGHIDAWELRTLVNLVLQQRLVMFTERNCGSVISELVFSRVGPKLISNILFQVFWKFSRNDLG